MSRKQKGGNRVSMPIEYFGGKSGSYFPEGSAELGPYNTAYGDSVSTSFGKDVAELGPQTTGPNLAPGSGRKSVNATNIQTGGSARRNRKKRRRVNRKKKKGGGGQKRKRTGTKSRKNKKYRGGFMPKLLHEAGKLAVPAGLWAAKQVLENMQTKKKTKKT
jgi:hypothetical protein